MDLFQVPSPISHNSQFSYFLSMVSFSFPALTMWLATVIYKSHDHQGQFRKPK